MDQIKETIAKVLTPKRTVVSIEHAAARRFCPRRFFLLRAPSSAMPRASPLPLGRLPPARAFRPSPSMSAAAHTAPSRPRLCKRQSTCPPLPAVGSPPGPAGVLTQAWPGAQYSVVGIIVLYVLKRLMGARSARKVAVRPQAPCLPSLLLRLRMSSVRAQDARKAAMDSRSAVARGTTPAALSGVNMSSGLSTTPAYTKAGGSAIQTSSAVVDPAHHTASHPSVVEIPMAKIIRGTTRYVLKCSTVDGRQWAIAKRYSEFDKLKDDVSSNSTHASMFCFEDLWRS